MSEMSPSQNGRNLMRQLRTQPFSMFALLRSVLLKNYGFPDLWLRWPQAIWRLGAALIGHTPFPVFTFSSFEIWLRSYYSKLARNFREFGRWGYVWDEGLGLPMGARFGSNWATYFIYGHLSPRAFSLLSVSLFIVSLLLTGIFLNEIFLALVLCVILLGSPLLIFSLAVRLVKPEVIWWSLAVPLIVSALSNHWEYVWIIIGFLLLVNTSVSVILGAVSAALSAWTLINGHTDWTAGLWWLIPGGLLRAWRFLHAYLDGNLGATVKEQARTSTALKKTGKLFQYALRILPPFLIAAWNHWQMAIIMFAVVLGLFVVNEYKFKVADKVTLDVIKTCSVVSLCLLSTSWWSLLGVLLVVVENPFSSAWRSGGRKRAEFLETEAQRVSPDLPARNAFYAKLVKEYPWFSPLPFPDAQKLKALFEAIPVYARVVLESDNDPREEGKFTRFHDWTYYYCADRNIEFINHTFLTRMLEPALAERYLNCLASPPLSAEVIQDVCERLGTRYFIAFSEETVSALRARGYHSILEVKPEEYSIVRDLLYMPETPLTLLEGPATASIISPSVTWTRQGNQIFWQAEAERVYQIRYRYYTRFSARQGDTLLKVTPFRPFDDLPLQFISVQAQQDGPLVLKYG